MKKITFSIVFILLSGIATCMFSGVADGNELADTYRSDLKQPAAIFHEEDYYMPYVLMDHNVVEADYQTYKIMIPLPPNIKLVLQTRSKIETTKLPIIFSAVKTRSKESIHKEKLYINNSITRNMKLSRTEKFEVIITDPNRVTGRFSADNPKMDKIIFEFPCDIPIPPPVLKP